MPSWLCLNYVLYKTLLPEDSLGEMLQRQRCWKEGDLV